MHTVEKRQARLIHGKEDVREQMEYNTPELCDVTLTRNLNAKAMQKWQM